MVKTGHRESMCNGDRVIAVKQQISLVGLHVGR